jgi:hypothetical protein
MITSTQTIVRTNILLNKPSEEFSVRRPARTRWERTGWGRLWRVNAIEVHQDCFFLIGGPGQNRSGASQRLDYSFRSPEELPTMPTYIADAVTRALANLAEMAK